MAAVCLGGEGWAVVSVLGWDESMLFGSTLARKMIWEEIYVWCTAVCFVAP